MAIVNTIADGNASDPTIWDSGAVPSAPDIAVIKHNVKLDIPNWELGADDGSSDALRIDSSGNLHWDGDVDVTVTLQGHFHQVAGGVVNFDGTANRDKKLTLKLNKSSSPAINKYKIIVEDVTNFIINGYETVQHVWVETYGATAGSTQIQVKDVNLISDWQVGDKLFIGYVHLSYNNANCTEFTISNINNDIIEFTPALPIDLFNGGAIANAERNIEFIQYQENTTNVRFEFPNGTTATNPFLLKWCYIKSKYNDSMPPVIQENHFINLQGVAFIGRRLWDRGLFTPAPISSFPIPFNKIVWQGQGHHDTQSVAHYWYNVQQITDIIQKDCYVCNAGMNSRLRFYKEAYVENCYFVIGILPMDGGYSTRDFKECIIYANDYIGVPDVSWSPTGYNFYNCKFYGNFAFKFVTNIDFKECKINLGMPSKTVTFQLHNAQFQKIDYVEFEGNIETYMYDDISRMYLFDVYGKHIFFDKWQKTYNQTTTKWQGNEAVEIQAVNAGTFKLVTKALVSAGAFYKWRIAMMKNASQSIPPKFRVLKGNTVIDEVQMTDSLNTWEELEISWIADFDGFVTVEFEFTADLGDGSEFFWLSDPYNSFHYWSEGYIIPVFPLPTNTPDVIAEAVWNYSIRKLTEGTRDTEIDSIKAKTDKLTFDNAFNVYSNNQNPSFTSSDRAKLNSLQNYDDTAVQQKLDLLKKLATNKAEIINNPDNSQTIKIYDDNQTTVLVTLTINADKTLRLPL